MSILLDSSTLLLATWFAAALDPMDVARSPQAFWLFAGAIAALAVLFIVKKTRKIGIFVLIAVVALFVAAQAGLLPF